MNNDDARLQGSILLLKIPMGTRNIFSENLVTHSQKGSPALDYTVAEKYRL
jgi:hypothetical protein